MMQLINEIQPTGDIQINMSAQAEHHVNSDIVDMKLVVSNANKENNPNIHDATLSIIAKCVNGEIETIQKTDMIGDKSENNYINGVETNNTKIGEVAVMAEDGLLNSIDTIVLENSTNCTSTVNEIKSDKVSSDICTKQHEVNNDVPRNKNSNSDDTQINSSVVATNLPFKMSTDKLLSTDITREDDATNVTVPTESQKTVNSETPMTLQETEYLEELDEKNVNTNVSTHNDNNKRICENSFLNDEETGTLAMAIKNVEPQNEDIDDGVITVKEMNTEDNLVRMSTDIAVNKDGNTITENTVLLNDISALKNKNHHEDIIFDKEPDNSSENLSELAIISKTGHINNGIMLRNTSLSKIDSSVENIAVEVEKMKQIDPDISVTYPENMASENTALNAEDVLCNDDIVINNKCTDQEVLKSAEDFLKIISDTAVAIVTSNDNTTLNTSDILEDVAMEEDIIKPAEKILSIASDISNDIVANFDSSTTLNTAEKSLSEKNEEELFIPAEKDLATPSNMSSYSDFVINNKASTIINAEDVLVPAVEMTEEIKKITQEVSEMSSNPSEDISESKTTEKNNKSAILEIENVENVENNEKLNVPTTETKEPITLSEEKLSLLKKDDIIHNECIIANNQDESLCLMDVDPKALIKDTHDITLAEPTVSSSSVSDKIVNDVVTDTKTMLETSMSVIPENQESVVSDIKAFNEKKTDNNVVSMEVDEIVIIDVDKEQEINSSSYDIPLKNVLNDETINIEFTRQEAKSENMNLKQTISNEVKKTEKLPENNDVCTAPIENKTILLDDKDKVEIIDEDDITFVDKAADETTAKPEEKEKSPDPMIAKKLPVVCKLSNTLDILSDEEDESSREEAKETEKKPEKQCIDIDDDDDIMLIEDDNSKEAFTENTTDVLKRQEDSQPSPIIEADAENTKQEIKTMDITELSPKIYEKDTSPGKSINKELDLISQSDKISEEISENLEQKKPLLPQNFLKAAKKNLADMTRDELEEFCILRIVESIVDRSNLSDIKSQIKTIGQNLEVYRKRAFMLTKQNRDLQVVLKSVQEEQKNRTNNLIQPLKITRSVGMQVLMNDKIDCRKKGLNQGPPSLTPVNRPPRTTANAKSIKPPLTPTNIPVPRKVPVSNSPAKALASSPVNNSGKTPSSTANSNCMRNPSPVQKVPEKRTHSRMQSTSSETVDLTEDEPPAKVTNIPPVRLVPPQNLMPQQRSFTQPLNSPRKVYIPISGPQGQNIRPGQTLMVKGGLVPGTRQRMPPMPRMQQSPIRVQKQVPQRHPAPLPDAMKQYTPPTWKALPPAPDLKLSKVENGIVISWKIDGYPEGGYETIASYQLYAYQETTAPPCTALWKKIGDVKALPLPMACTLTQFMAGFKYYFAVRAVDIRSRLGPFSLPGSILLLNKM